MNLDGRMKFLRDGVEYQICAALRGEEWGEELRENVQLWSGMVVERVRAYVEERRRQREKGKGSPRGVEWAGEEDE